MFHHVFSVQLLTLPADGCTCEIVHVFENLYEKSAPVTYYGLCDLCEDEWRGVDPHGQAVELVVFPPPFEPEVLLALLGDVDMEERIGDIDNATVRTASEYLPTFLPDLLQFEPPTQLVWLEGASVNDQPEFI